MSGLARAIEFAARVHRDQFDRSGSPYILHPLRVMLAMATEEQRIVAVLHDTVEDGPAQTLERILWLFGPVIAEAVEVLTKKPGETYAAYIERVAANPLATVVKLADLADNLGRAPVSDTLRSRYEKAKARLLEPSAPLSTEAGR